MNAKWDRHNNCFGYAVDIKEWLLPSNDDSGYWQDMVHELQSDYGLKLVEKSEMVLGKEYVAYRYGSRDFHFMKRDAKGHWRHKMGGRYAQPISQKEVFKKSWYFGGAFYNSKLYLFEKLQ